ncbi:MAG: hypothetical protein VR64_06615 [Desulfatitalea sp. BRH_c12]|nr:MAG: hypothetical protein VR64_06615 [Desulfatitalea sp. BRH_c12]
MIYLVLYVFISFIVGLMGTNRKFGFWGNFFYSLLFTPFLGIILLFASSKKVPVKYERNGR